MESILGGALAGVVGILGGDEVGVAGLVRMKKMARTLARRHACQREQPAERHFLLEKCEGRVRCERELSVGVLTASAPCTRFNVTIINSALITLLEQTNVWPRRQRAWARVRRVYVTCSSLSVIKG